MSNPSTEKSLIESAESQKLAAPFDSIFKSWEEAQWVFDFFKDSLLRMGVESPDDSRIAVTLTQRNGNRRIHINIRNWLILGIRGPDMPDRRVRYSLLKDRVHVNERFTLEKDFKQEDDELQVASYGVPLDVVKSSDPDLKRAFQETLDFIGQRFGHQGRARVWRHHEEKSFGRFSIRTSGTNC